MRSTSSKSASRYDVRDLFGELTTTVHTVTVPHRRQKNLLISGPSTPVEFTNFGYAPDFPFFQFGIRPEPLVQIAGVPQNSTYFTIVNYGGLGGEALLDQQGEFFTLSESELFIDRLSTKRIDVSSLPQPPGEYEGEVVLTGDGTFQPLRMPVSLLSIPSPADPDGVPEQRRVDLVSGRTTLRSTATFRNDGDEVLSGAVTSDVPWIIPVTEYVSVPPHGSADVQFDIDPQARLDSSRENGVSYTGTLRVEYADEVEPVTNGFGYEDQHTTGVSTTLSTVVSTIPPDVSDGDPPPFDEVDAGFLIPGLQQSVATFTDVSIANAFGALRIDDLRAFFTGAGSAGSSRLATFKQLGSRGVIMLGSPLRTMFSQPSGSGAIQVRSTESGSVLVSARRLHVEEEGLAGTALPVFAAERRTEAGEQINLTGLASSDRKDLFIQATSAAGATVEIEMLDSSGEEVGTLGPLEIGEWGVIELQSFAPAATATAIVRVEESSPGPVVAYALLYGENGTDPWVVVDWNAYWGEPRTSTLVVPIARRDGPVLAEGRRRGVLRPGAVAGDRTTVDLALFNPTASEAVALLNFHEVDGGSYEAIVAAPSRRTITISDVVATFGLDGTVDGHITVTPLRGEVTGTARLVTRRGGATRGSAIQLRPRWSGVRLGERRSIGAVEDSRQKTIDDAIPTTWQTRFRLLETSGESVTVRATIRVATGAALAAAVVRRELELAPNQMLPLGPIGRAIMGEARETSIDDLHDLVVEFDVLDGDGSVLIITEMVENATGDTLIRFD